MITRRLDIHYKRIKLFDSQVPHTVTSLTETSSVFSPFTESPDIYKCQEFVMKTFVCHFPLLDFAVVHFDLSSQVLHLMVYSF